MSIRDTDYKGNPGNPGLPALGDANYYRKLGKELFGSSETSEEQERRLKEASPYGHFKTWRLVRIIIKSGDDLRSEQFAMQLIETIDLIFKKRKLKLKLSPYEILSTG